MAPLSKMLALSAVLMTVSAVPSPGGSPHKRHRHHRHQERGESCDFGTPEPEGWTEGMGLQWCGMINNEVAGLNVSENPTVMIPNLEAIFKQAGISAPCDSALPNIKEIMQDPQARAAMEQMKANYPKFGSMDLTPEDIGRVYAPAIEAASAKTGVPQNMLVKIIWTESKGHPLVYQGLCQIDYVGWGQQVDKDPSLKNRYTPSDNIMSAAMYLAEKKDAFGGDWETCYKNHYQDPGAAARGY